jgi:hypothetical protein
VKTSLRGNKYTAMQDRMGHWTITRLSDGANCYLQGDDAVEFTDNHRLLGAITYPSGPFKTQSQHIDACLSDYDHILQPIREVRP